MGDLGKLIVAKGFKKLPKVQKIAKSGHTGYVFDAWKVAGSKWVSRVPHTIATFIWPQTKQASSQQDQIRSCFMSRRRRRRLASK